MKPISDDELRLAIEEQRPEPRPQFSAELDARAAAGFPRRRRARRLSPVLAWARSPKPRKLLLPAGGTALAAIIAVAVVIGTQGSERTQLLNGSRSGDSAGSGPMSKVVPFSDEDEAGAGAIDEPATEEEASQPSAAPATGAGDNFDGSGPYLRAQERAIERSSQITLGTAPENLGIASSEVFDAVHDYRGIVLRSQTSDGSAARAEARFELLIPSNKLGDAMAAFSQIGEVRSRSEATADITAPTVSAAAQLEDSRARIDSLLDQLAAAATEGEREAVERELRGERRRAAVLEAKRDRLERRASLSRVSLRIVGGEATGATGEGGAWGIGDALDDAGQVLGVATAVTLLALAVLAPLALIGLLIWLGRRTYLRRARHTVLG